MPALMEGVERTNMVMIRGQRQEMGAAPRRDPYVMEIDTATSVEDLGTWSDTVETGEEEG